MAVVAQPHGDGQRIAGVAEVVAQDAVERGQHRLPLGAGDAVAEERPELREGGVDAGADEMCDAADGLVDHPGHEAHGTVERAAEDGRPPADGEVHRLDEVGDAPRRFDGQPARAPQIIDVVARLSCHQADGGPTTHENANPAEEAPVTQP